MAVFSKRQQALGLFFWLCICFLVALLGATASIQAKSFYAQLTQPEWAPPAWLFGPVWTFLYVLIAFSAWLVWCHGGRSARVALSLFLIQLALNGLWSWLFFAWHLGAYAFVNILFLWGMIVATLIAFWRVSPLASFLLLPYLLWVSFAAALNFSIWQLNLSVLS